jgi:hypothetical protein
MADIDFITDFTDGTFRVSLDDNPKKVTGNRALLNRFEITFLTKTKTYIMEDESVYIDNYGGNSNELIINSSAINDANGIAANISICIEKTVASMQSDQDSGIPDNERILKAGLLNIYIQNGSVYATIEVTPVKYDSYEELSVNLPIIKGR